MPLAGAPEIPLFESTDSSNKNPGGSLALPGFVVGTGNGLYLHRGLGGVVEQDRYGAAGEARFG